MRPLRRLYAALAAVLAFAMGPPRAQAQGVPPDLADALGAVLPTGQRFAELDSDPPVIRAFRTDPSSGRETLVGYAFLTSDFPPEEMGFDGPIEVLVGMDTLGVLTGVRVLRYRESLRSSRGDFLSTPGFQEQFAGKSASEAFQVKRDVEGITGATISVGAMSRGIRASARRVALSLGIGAVALASRRTLLDPVTVPLDQLAALSWTEMLFRGLVQQIQVLDGGRTTVNLSLLYLRDDSVAERVIGPTMLEQVRTRSGARASARHWIVAGVDGPMGGGVNLGRLAIVQDGDTLEVEDDDVLLFGPPREGKLDGQAAMTRIVLVDRAVDMSRPFTFLLDLRPGLGIFQTEYPGRRAAAEVSVVAPSGAPTGEASVGAGAPAAGGADPASQAASAAAPGASPAAPAAPSGPSPAGPSAEGPRDPAQALAPPLDFALEQEETLLSRTLAGTSWARVAALAALLVLASAAFAAKRPRLRWAALLATLLYLGVLDKGFLSVSHITSGIKVGAGVYLADLPLLLLVAFTVLTTLLWGRVFCGYLCPFGALQDVLERVTPRRWRRGLPSSVHRRALLLKYGVLAVVVAPALLGGSVSLYQYFEPFGTVFFGSRSVLLWTIAGLFLTASVAVPRFYCRYVCPLGAALALASLLSPFRIRRVEQCGVCKVCEQRCPTGAIRAERVDFPECVRCNVCETKLIEKAGVCRHDMAEVRGRLALAGPAGLVQIEARGSRPRREPRA
jgi:NAD-dependent dihydropyrimidine dehydrogenase PreA subunit